MDPLMLLFLLIAGLTGADSLSTVRWVSVQRGGSVTIPCLYEDRYKEHVKYWCKGDREPSCTPIVRTDSPQKKGDVSIRDDPDQRVFTVTMNNLTTGDSSYYWCGVEIRGGLDDGVWVKLSVTVGSPELSVDKQEVTAVEGDGVSVQCRYRDSSRQMMWCKIGGSCVSGNSGSLDGRRDEIRDVRVNKVLSVTMRGLERKHTGWYWCGDGDLQIPVHITVNTRTTAITEGLMRSSVTETIKASAAGFTTKMLLQTDSAHDEGGNIGKESSLVQLPLSVGLGSLVLLFITIIIITWKVLDKHKKKMARNQNRGRTEFTSSVDPGADVTYSSIVLPDPEMSSRCPSAATPANDVVYSSVALKHSE